MPIYAYRCAACGYAKDMLQKIADPVLTQCPACQQPQFAKQLTAAGFQLKGTGWYATDFSGRTPAAPASDTSASNAQTATKTEATNANTASVTADSAA